MRRRDREIAEFEQLLAAMAQCEVCYVGFHDDEYPYVVPMNFGLAVEGQQITLYFHGAGVGKKHDLLAKNNQVSFAMAHTGGLVTGPRVGVCECTMLFESIMGTGKMDYADEGEKRDGLSRILDQYHVAEGPDYQFHDEIVAKTAVLKLVVERISGKRRTVG